MKTDSFSMDKLKGLQAISQQMLQSAQQEEWQKLPLLEQQRKALMHGYFEEVRSEKEVEIIATVINSVLSINREIEQLAREQQKKINRQLQNMKKRQNAHSAYMQNN